MHAAVCEDAFQRVHAMLGIPLKEGKDKVAARVEALGGELVSTKDVLALLTTEGRRTHLTRELENFPSELQRGRDAGK